MHNGLLNLGGEKMSKSIGNIFTVRDVLKQHDGETLRFFMLRTHYRSAVAFGEANLDDARAGLRRLYTALDAVPATGEAGELDWAESRAAAFMAAMNDDFNTPIAVSVLFDLAGEINRSRRPADAGLLRSLGKVLGILQQPARAFLQSAAGGRAGGELDDAAILALIEARAQAKLERDFKRADGIRAGLEAQGILLQDSAAGTTWVRS